MRAMRNANPVESSRDNVGRELIFGEPDPVAQEELPLLQPLHLQQVGTRRALKRLDRGIEVAMLLQQTRQLRSELAFFLSGHMPKRLSAVRRAPSAAPKPE